jgi:hypothetical protein
MRRRRRAYVRQSYKDGSASQAFFQVLYAAKNCFYCSVSLDGQYVHADHRIPLRAIGAPHTAWNMVPACSQCNYDKNDLVYLEQVQAVLSTTEGGAWALGAGRAWVAYVMPRIQDGPRSARVLFAREKHKIAA